MWYKKFEKNVYLEEFFFFLEKFLSWKCDIKDLKKILYMWKNFSWIMDIINVQGKRKKFSKKI